MPRLTSAATFAVALGALALAAPAAAQFGSIFGGNNEPPRPPANVGPPAGDDRYYQSAPIYPRQPQQVQPPPQTYPQQQSYPPPPGFPQQQAYPPPPGSPQPYPPPPGSPQQAGRPGGIQQQTLAPPPGGAAAPEAQPSSLPGLPPGQRQPRGNPGDTAALQPADEVVTPPPAQKIPNERAVFSGLDKITGRIISFDVAINETVQFGALQVTPRVCYTRPPTETPNTDAFLEVDEITLQNEIKRVFTGWMFAASPGLHAIEHPIYDIWLADCKGAQAPAVAAAETPPAQPPQAVAPRPQQKAPRKQQAAQPPAPPPPNNSFPYVR